MNNKHLCQNPQYVKPSFKQMKMLSLISLAILLLTGILAGCGRTVEDSVPTAESESAPKEETEQDLTKELDAIVAQFELEDLKIELADLSQDENAADFPAELIAQLQEALGTGTSDALLKELNDSTLRINRSDFTYVPYEGEPYSFYTKDINAYFSDQNQSSYDLYDFYKLDMDQDGLDEIIMAERTPYGSSDSSHSVILRQNNAGSYEFAGYNHTSYYRLYAIFSYEGTYYMVCNYDDSKRKTTKALGLFDLSTFGKDSRWLSDQEHIYLRQNRTNGEIQKLWTAEQKNEASESASLQDAIQTYIQEIGLDLMLRNQSSKSFSGMEEAWSKEELSELADALEDVFWTPVHLDYAAQEQQWLFELAGQQIYFVLYYDKQTTRYLLEAFLYHVSPEKAALEPAALYGIKPQVQVDSVGYRDYANNNVRSICYVPEDASGAFPENRQEVTEQLWQQAQTQILSSTEQDIILSENTSSAPAAENSSAGSLVPAKLIQMAKEALYTRDWSAFDALAAPLELTDHDKALEAWAASVENMQDGTDDWLLTSDKEAFDSFKQHICHIYQYNIGESQFWLFVVDSGGTARFVNIFCYRLTETGYEHINSVGTLDLNARVVPYEGGLYLVDTTYNYYSKYRDTIYLYPLTSEGISEQAVRITLAPVDYIWTSAYQSDTPVQEQIDDYVSSIQKELMDASPINDDITVFTGCEELVTDPVKLQRLFNKNSWYMVDYDNDGQLEYLRRYYWFPSNYTTLLLLTEEYRLEDITWKLGESWEPECPYWSDTLIQRWYQEFDGQIYTFQLFLTEGYNYYMNVSLWEREHVSWIASYYITPRCELQVEAVGKEMTGAG